MKSTIREESKLSLLEQLLTIDYYEKWDSYNDCPSGRFTLDLKKSMNEEEARRIRDLIHLLVAERLSTCL